MKNSEGHAPATAGQRARREIFVLRTLVAALAAALAWAASPEIRDWTQTYADRLGISRVAKGVPREQEIRDVIKDLRYSGLPGLLRPEVRLEADFENRRWRLLNIHRFDASGRVLLDEGRYGICGDLAAHTFQEIQPLFDHRYSIRIVNAAESSYFPTGIGTHMVIRIRDITSPAAPKTYILDPSFRRYGPETEFLDYRFFKDMSYMDLMRKQSEHEERSVGNAMPIFIRKNILLSLLLDDVDGRFDPQNVALAVTATKKHEYASKVIMGARLRNGRMETSGDEALAGELLSDDEAKKIRQRFLTLFRQAAEARP